MRAAVGEIILISVKIYIYIFLIYTFLEKKTYLLNKRQMFLKVLSLCLCLCLCLSLSLSLSISLYLSLSLSFYLSISMSLCLSDYFCLLFISFDKFVYVFNINTVGIPSINNWFAAVTLIISRFHW